MLLCLLGKNPPYLCCARRSLFLIVIVASLVFFAPKSSNAVDVTLAWDANMETDLAGYRIYHRKDGQTYDYDDPLWEGSDTVCTVYNLDETANHYFVARAFDILGDESTDSSEVHFQGSVNIAPTADAGPDQTVDEGMTVTLNGSNSADPDDTILSCQWTQTGGTHVFLSDAASAQPTFIAPCVGLTGEALIFQLTVQDDGGLADTDTGIINVSNVNQAPAADAGPDQTVEEGNTVTLDGSNSSDPDGTVVSYSWTQIGGMPVTLSEAMAGQSIFTAPEVGSSGASLTFQLTIVDDGGLRSEDTCIVNVSWVNVAPTADAGPDQMVNKGMMVTLDGSNSTDPDGSITAYVWKQTAGSPVTLSDNTFAQPTFVAPYVGSTDEALTFQLTVYDGGGLADTDIVVVNVSNVNHAPVADAGPDQTVQEQSTVTLDGSNSSDIDGAVVSYGWTQIGGAPVSLSEATAAQPIFVAPEVNPVGASLTFQLTVVDDGGLRSEDTCIVNVSWINVAPTADAGSDQTVNEGTMVTLDGSNSTDPDGSITAYVWKQTAGSPVTLSDGASAQPTFLVPYVGSTDKALTFQLTVYDGGGLADTDTVIINVTDVNQAPVADAGPDQTVEEGDTVALDGSNSSDPDGDLISHLWTQTDGTPMTLSNPRAVNPAFACPFSGRDEVLTFQLTVTDTGELSAADSVIINVNPSLGNSVQTIFDLKAKGTGKGIRLDWSPVPDTTGYNIYRSCMSGGPYSQVGDCPAKDKCTFLDNNVLIGVTYYYLVRSVKGETESLDSNKVSTTLFNRGKK